MNSFAIKFSYFPPRMISLKKKEYISKKCIDNFPVSVAPDINNKILLVRAERILTGARLGASNIVSTMSPLS